MRDSIIIPTDEGLFCPAGNFHIDPWRPVATAVITHAHADHARSYPDHRGDLCLALLPLATGGAGGGADLAVVGGTSGSALHSFHLCAGQGSAGVGGADSVCRSPRAGSWGDGGDDGDLPAGGCADAAEGDLYPMGAGR